MLKRELIERAVRGISPKDGRYVVAQGQSGMVRMYVEVYPMTSKWTCHVFGLGDGYASTVDVGSVDVDSAIAAAQKASMALVRDHETLGASWEDVAEGFAALREDVGAFWRTSPFGKDIS